MLLTIFLKSKCINRVLEDGVFAFGLNNKAMGFKEIRHHLMRFKPLRERYLSEHFQFQLILLRRNILQRWVSIMVAKKKVKFASTSESVSKRKYKLPLKNLLRDLSSLEQVRGDVLNYKKGSIN
jgi:hypothetical protein